MYPSQDLEVLRGSSAARDAWQSPERLPTPTLGAAREEDDKMPVSPKTPAPVSPFSAGSKWEEAWNKTREDGAMETLFNEQEPSRICWIQCILVNPQSKG